MPTLDGRFVRELDLPGIGTAQGFGGRPQDSETFYTFTSFNSPGRTYRYDLATGENKLFREPKIRFNPDDYEVKQIFYPSKDGTKIPMFISHKKGLKLDGSTPTLLYGYGGFNISLTPQFSISKLAWLEMGGVYAVANIRGGGEYGRDWHRAATRLKRPRAYDDFIAAAEWLIKHDYTRPDKLAIQGGSNGGLLVGAALTQRPDLFRAVVCQVPLLDMLRYQNLRIARLWIPEYGSAEDADQFRWLYAYSPYHHVAAGQPYPATFLLTAEGDSRVDPMHARKMAARLQSATSSASRPILLRVETAAGHGQGKPRSKQVEEATDIWSFLFWQLNVNI
jgi:prolyl oligopeptidase